MHGKSSLVHNRRGAEQVVGQLKIPMSSFALVDEEGETEVLALEKEKELSPSELRRGTGLVRGTASAVRVDGHHSEKEFKDSANTLFKPLDPIHEDSYTAKQHSQDSHTHRHRHNNHPSDPRQPQRRSYVNTHFASRNRPSRLQQQLGSLPNASLQSLISTLTTTSSGSSGSSTATQKSYNKLAIRRRRAAKRRSKSIEEDLRGVGGGQRRRAVKGRMEQHKSLVPADKVVGSEIGNDRAREVKDVRANVSRPVSSASRASRKDSILSPPTPSSRRPSAISTSSRTSSKNAADVSHSNWKRQETFNSDSGISVTSSPDRKGDAHSTAAEEKSDSESSSDSDDDSSSSGDEDTPQGLLPSPYLPPVAGLPSLAPLRALPDSDPLVQRVQDQEAAMKHHMLHSPQPKRKFRPHVNPSHSPSPALPLYDASAMSGMPNGYPVPPMAPLAPLTPHGDLTHSHSDYASHEQHVQTWGPQFHFDCSKTTVVGYEKLAGMLTAQHHEGGIKGCTPLYRRFEQLNHRVLLHLQDEISELEEELRMLDERIAQLHAASQWEDEPAVPASRRWDHRYGSELHFQRTQVLGKVFMKLQQYNQALASYSTSKTKIVPGKQEEITAYRTWMNEHNPLHPIETHFLDDNHSADLISPAAPTSSTPPFANTTSHHNNQFDLKQLIMFLYFTVILLLLAFSMLPGFMSKVLVLGVVVGCTGGFVWRDLPASGYGHGDSKTEKEVKSA